MPVAAGAPRRRSGQPEFLAARRLQVIPNDFPVETPEFMAGDFHVHAALVHQALVAAVGADGPDAVHFVPRMYLLQLAEPLRAAVNEAVEPVRARTKTALPLKGPKCRLELPVNEKLPLL